MPIAKSTGNERIIKGMFEVVRDAKKDIETNKNDLEQIEDLIEKIKNLVIN
jgi:predicted AAA+ superfamily ATPase